MAGEAPGGREGRAESQAGAGTAAESGRAAIVTAVCADREPGSAADAVRVRAVDSGDGLGGDPPRVRRQAECGVGGASAAQARAVAAAAATPGLSAGSGGGQPVEERGIPRDPGPR